MATRTKNPFTGESGSTCSIALKHVSDNAAAMKKAGLTEAQYAKRESAAIERGGTTKRRLASLTSPSADSPFVAPPDIRKKIERMARAKIKSAPVPSPEAIAKAHAELEKAKAGLGRAGGESRGGSAAGRRKQRQNLFEEFGGNERGYVPCHGCGTKMHWADKGPDNPEGYARFERGKIFVKCQGGGYQLLNLLPECFACNRSRNDAIVRRENPCG